MAQRMFFRVSPPQHLERLREKLQEFEGIVSIARIPGAKADEESGFVVFDNEAHRQGCFDGVQGFDGVTLSLEEPKSKSVSRIPRRSERPEKQVLAEEYFKFDAYRMQRETRGRGSRGRGRESREDTSQQAPNRPPRFGERGRGRSNQPFIPTVKGFIAFVANVPVNVTNTQIAEFFGGCGNIFDIDRVENCALIFFDSKEAVDQAVVNLNGKSFKGGVLTVSRGGTVRAPIPAPSQ